MPLTTRIPTASFIPPPESQLFLVHELQALGLALKAGQLGPIRVTSDLRPIDTESERVYLAARLCGVDVLDAVVVESGGCGVAERAGEGGASGLAKYLMLMSEVLDNQRSDSNGERFFSMNEARLLYDAGD